MRASSTFKGQVLTLMTGSALAQVVSLLFTPLLTRLYSPGDFGVFAIFNSIVAIWSLLTTLRLENALLLPKSEHEAHELLSLGLWSALVTSTIFGGCLQVFSLASRTQFLQLSVTVGQYAPWIAVNCFLLGCANLLCQWHNRHGRFHVYARRIVIERGIFIATSLALATRGPAGLIAGQVLSTLFVLAFVLISGWNNMTRDMFVFRRRHLSVLSAYRGFSLKHGAGTLLQVAAWQLPPVLISLWFPLELVGKYNLATRLLDAPVSFIGSSFCGVFYRKLSVTDPGQWHGLLVRTLRPLVYLPPIGIFGLIFFAPQIFALAFGATWFDAGRFFAALIVLYWWRLIYTACSPTYLVLNRLDADLFFSFLLLCSQLLSVYAGHRLFNDLYASLVLTSILTSSVIILSIVWVYRAVGSRRANSEVAA